MAKKIKTLCKNCGHESLHDDKTLSSAHLKILNDALSLYLNSKTNKKDDVKSWNNLLRVHDMIRSMEGQNVHRD